MIPADRLANSGGNIWTCNRLCTPSQLTVSHAELARSMNLCVEKTGFQRDRLTEIERVIEKRGNEKNERERLRNLEREREKRERLWK